MEKHEQNKNKQSGYEYGTDHSLKHAASETQKDRLEEKKAKTHRGTTQTHENRQTEKECA